MRVRGEYGFSSLLKQNKKAKICFVIYIAGFFFKKNFCYEVFAKQKKTEESSNNYFGKALKAVSRMNDGRPLLAHPLFSRGTPSSFLLSFPSPSPHLLLSRPFFLFLFLPCVCVCVSQ